MIEFTKQQAAATSWQESFVAMLPEIETRLRNEFLNLNPSCREEAIREGVAHCLFAYARLFDRGLAHIASSFTLVRYSARHVRRGRPAAGRMSCKEPLSRYAQIRKGIRLDSSASAWIDQLAEDKRATVPDQVAAKLDFSAWFATLSYRMKEIAKDMALGSRTKEIAAKHRVTPGRISQMRRSLERSWAEFQGEVAPASS